MAVADATLYNKRQWFDVSVVYEESFASGTTSPPDGHKEVNRCYVGHSVSWWLH